MADRSSPVSAPGEILELFKDGYLSAAEATDALERVFFHPASAPAQQPASPESGEALKPCPFCDGRDISEARGRDNWPVAMCDDCGAMGPCIELDRKAANDLWNTRAAPAGDNV